MKSSAYKIRDCFALLATTTLGTFYDTLKISNAKFTAKHFAFFNLHFALIIK